MENDEFEVSIKDLYTPFTNAKAVFYIFILGVLVFFTGLFNGFVGDDRTLISVNPYVHSITNIGHFFSSGAFYFADGNPEGNNYYKPLLDTTYSLIYTFFGENSLPFHLIQILLHISNSILVFVIFSHFFKKGWSFFAALIFLIHPINLESAIYIAALQDTLYLFFGLLAIYFSIKKNNKLLNFLIPLFLLLSVFSKETGVLFLLTVPVFNYLFQKRSLIKYSFQSGFVFLIYLFFRLVVAQITISGAKIVPIMDLSLLGRILNIPKIIFYYLTTFIFPKTLITSQVWVVKSVNFEDFWRPLFFDSLFLFFVLTAGFIIYKKSTNFKLFCFFLVWFLAGLIMHSQIIPLDETVSDRWFYFPIIGLLGLIATIINNNSKTKVLWLIVGVVIISTLSIRTVIRITNWRDETTLVTTDIKNNPKSFQLVTGLGLIAGSKGKIDEAEKDFILATDLYPSTHTYSELANFYIKTNQFDKAKKVLEVGFKYGDYYELYSYYSYTLLVLGENKTADEFIDISLAKYPNSFLFWTYKAVARSKLQDHSAAINAIEKAYKLNPNDVTSQFLNAILNNQDLKFSLNPGT